MILGTRISSLLLSSVVALVGFVFVPSAAALSASRDDVSTRRDASTCVETSRVSTPIFDSETMAASLGIDPDPGPVRWCESPESPECQRGDEVPRSQHDSASDQGDMLRVCVRVTDHSLAYNAHARRVADNGARPDHRWRAKRPPAA